VAVRCRPPTTTSHGPLKRGSVMPTRQAKVTIAHSARRQVNDTAAVYLQTGALTSAHSASNSVHLLRFRSAAAVRVLGLVLERQSKQHRSVQLSPMWHNPGGQPAQTGNSEKMPGRERGEREAPGNTPGEASANARRCC